MEMPHQHSQRRKLLFFGRAINSGGGGGIIGLVYAGYVLLASQCPLPHYSLFYSHIILVPMLVTLGKK